MVYLFGNSKSALATAVRNLSTGLRYERFEDFISTFSNPILGYIHRLQQHFTDAISEQHTVLGNLASASRMAPH